MKMIKNARITSTMLGREDHGIMTFIIYIDAGNTCILNADPYPIFNN